jgi:hypothetical protein
MVLFGNCCFQVILTACSLHAYRLSTRVMLHNTHARSSADSFAVGSGVWSVFVMFSLAYFGTQSQILFPAADDQRNPVSSGRIYVDVELSNYLFREKD